MLFVAALAAIVMANTGASALYDAIIHFPARPGGETSAHLTVQSIVNDGLMAVFFLAVGLEVKYELLQGAFNSRARAAFPAISALEGMVALAIIDDLRAIVIIALFYNSALNPLALAAAGASSG